VKTERNDLPQASRRFVAAVKKGKSGCVSVDVRILI
jgi:hypothetical protein